MSERINVLTLKKLGIDTQKEFIVFMRRDCEVCVSEGFQALTRIEVNYGNKTIIAALNIVISDLLNHHEASLSESAWDFLGAKNGDEIMLRHLAPIESYHFVKQKILGKKLTPTKYQSII